jgi:ssDNA thymidine ADP-ribosyltransferase, DarT
MKRADLAELQCIAPIANLMSIADLGILCHNLAAGLAHEDVSDHTIQDRRHGKVVPHESGDGRELHDYANVYICARNPMTYVRREQHTRLAVLDSGSV